MQNGPHIWRNMRKIRILIIGLLLLAIMGCTATSSVQKKDVYITSVPSPDVPCVDIRDTHIFQGVAWVYFVKAPSLAELRVYFTNESEEADITISSTFKEGSKKVYIVNSFSTLWDWESKWKARRKKRVSFDLRTVHVSDLTLGVDSTQVKEMAENIGEIYNVNVRVSRFVTVFVCPTKPCEGKSIYIKPGLKSDRKTIIGTLIALGLL